MSKATFQAGLAAGIVSGMMVVAPKKKKLVGYSYNGVTMPVYPSDWDKKAYPYAAILFNSTDIFFATFSLPLQYTTLYADFDGDEVPETKSLLCSYAPPNIVGKSIGYMYFLGTWLKVSADEFDGGTRGIYYTFMQLNQVPWWSNVDIINTDNNSVYFEGSEPEPVYE